MFHPIYINEGRLNNRNLSLYNEKQLNSTPKRSLQIVHKVCIVTLHERKIYCRYLASCS